MMDAAPSTPVLTGASHGLSPYRILARRLRLRSQEALLSVRGFVAQNEVKRHRLETAGQAFLAGYNVGLTEFDPGAIRARLATVTLPDRGFAFEGAAMGVAVGEALPFSPPNRLTAFISDVAHDHVYLGHVGIGWAMSRTPWRSRVLLGALDPLLKWLAWDGRGFHDVYFRRRGALSGIRRHSGRYASRAYDQGAGRALWFATGGNARAAVRLIRDQEPCRVADLISGLALAIAYVGAATEEDLGEISAAADEFRAQLAQGAAFAAEARVLAGNLVADTEAACRAFCGCSAEAAAAVVRALRCDLPPESDVTPHSPPYEVWRNRIGKAFTRNAESIACSQR